MLDSGLISAAICFMGVFGFGRILHDKRDGWWSLGAGVVIAVTSALSTHDPSLGWPLAAVAAISLGAVGVGAWRARQRRPWR